MLKKNRLKSIIYVIALLFAGVVWADMSNSGDGNQIGPSGGSGSTNRSGASGGTGTTDANSSNTTTSSNAPNVTLSSSTRDQEDLTKLFDKAKYENFAKRKSRGGYEDNNND